MNERMVEMLDKVHKDLVLLANEVEDAIYKAVQALETQNKEQAKQVRKGDKNINFQEVKIEKQIFELMALQQPVATDLRFMVSALKMNNDLERIGDHAKSISKIAVKLSREPLLEPVNDITLLAKIARDMLHDAVQSFINRDTQLARNVRQRDKNVDKLNKKFKKHLYKKLEERPDKIKQGYALINVAQHIERIADLAKNISEDVVFMQEAKIIRYGIDKQKKI